MTVGAIGAGRRSAQWPLSLRLALRELRAGLGGFYVFIGCVALGVAVITAVAALSDGVRTSFERQGEKILGGDVAVARTHKRASAEELTWLSARGRVSETATLRAMARTLDGNEQALIELKPVDQAYPLFGEVRLRDGKALGPAIHQTGGAVLEPILLERLKVVVGDRIRIGNIDLPVTGVIEAEPDAIGDRTTFGPRVMISTATLDKTGLVQPGTLIRWRYAVRLTEGRTPPADLDRFRDAFQKAWPEAGVTVTDRREPSPRVSETLDRLKQFLTLIGLTALLVGGVGVANSVSTFIDKRRRVVATMKSLGAGSVLVFKVFLAQVTLIALIGIAAGLIVGDLVPWAVVRWYGSALPIEPQVGLSGASIAIATAYGLLVSLLFALWPLGRAANIHAAVLFREDADRRGVWPPRAVTGAIAVTAAALVALAVASSEQWKMALYFCFGLAGLLAVFFAVGTLLASGARRLPRPRTPELALALGNIGGPEGLTRAVVMSLGIGLSLLVTVALCSAAIVEELTARVPAQSPSYFVLDLPRGELETFRKTVTDLAPGAIMQEVPMLRGRLVRLNDTPVDQIKAPPEAQWVLNGDRGLTFSETVPEGSEIVAGSWWPKDDTGEPLVSFEAALAKNLGLKLGDTVTVNVLGRNVTARISSLRDVKWESLAINFVMVFSPRTLQAAPYNLLATVTLPEGTPLATEAEIARALGRTLPAVTAIRVKDAIDSFNAIVAKVLTAVRVAGSVTLLAGALVLAGALATAQRRRIQQSVVLKVVGATRVRILMSHAIEYALLSAVSATLAVGLGTATAWGITTYLIKVPFVFTVGAVAQALGLALALVLTFGGIGTWMVLKAPAVPYLRSE